MSLDEIRPLVKKMMDMESRSNSFKETKYWYPLAMATYGEDEVLEAIESMCTFRTTMWEKVQNFETKFGELHDAEAVMVNSGSSADLLSSFLLHEKSGGNLVTGDEVLVSAVTWPTQVWSLAMAGFEPKFVDVDPFTLNMNVEDLESKIGPRTRAIALVHLMGNTSNISEIETLCKRHNLELIEDCCEALGTEWKGQKVGTFGQTGTYSFFFSHHIVTMEGGMVITKDEEAAEKLRLLRAHGWARNSKRPQQNNPKSDPRYTFLSWGFNVRPTELQAGFGIVQLGRLPKYMEARVSNAAKIHKIVSKYPDLMSSMHIPEDTKCSWFAFPIMVKEEAPFTRTELTDYLESIGVETRPVVAGNLARQPAIEKFPSLLGGSLPGADLVHDNGFYLGIHPIDLEEQLDRLDTELEKFIKRHG